MTNDISAVYMLPRYKLRTKHIISSVLRSVYLVYVHVQYLLSRKYIIEIYVEKTKVLQNDFVIIRQTPKTAIICYMFCLLTADRSLCLVALVLVLPLCLCRVCVCTLSWRKMWSASARSHRQTLLNFTWNTKWRGIVPMVI